VRPEWFCLGNCKWESCAICGRGYLSLGCQIRLSGYAERQASACTCLLRSHERASINPLMLCSPQTLLVSLFTCSSMVRTICCAGSAALVCSLKLQACLQEPRGPAIGPSMILAKAKYLNPSSFQNPTFNVGEETAQKGSRALKTRCDVD